MDIEQALTTAMEYERTIRDLYLEAVQATEDPTGKSVFQELADDEQYHLDYLQSRLEEWRQTGAVSVQELSSTIPDRETIQRQAAKLQSQLSSEDRGLKIHMLGKALKLEKQTSAFYQRLVDSLPGDLQTMFSRFLEIENNHVEAVQFELDHVSHNGYWFGFGEFNLEVE
jgi:rubrerythrin